MIGRRYESAGRIIEILTETVSGYRALILADSDAEAIGAEIELTAAELGSCYDPL